MTLYGPAECDPTECKPPIYVKLDGLWNQRESLKRSRLVVVDKAVVNKGNPQTRQWAFIGGFHAMPPNQNLAFP